MRSAAGLAAALALAGALAAGGCKREQPAKTPPDVAAAPPASAAPEAAPAPLVIDADVVNRYLSWWEQHLQLVRTVVAEVDEAARQGAAFNRAVEIERRLERDLAKLRREFRFDQRELEHLEDFFGQLAVALTLTNEQGSGEVLAGLRAELAELPPERRPGAEAELAELERSFRAMTRHEALRARFGDAAVDAALAHAERITDLQERQLQLLGDLP